MQDYSNNLQQSKGALNHDHNQCSKSVGADVGFGLWPQLTCTKHGDVVFYF